MLKAILFTLIAVAIAMLLLCVRVILKKNGHFSSQHLSQSKAMRQRGIGCVISEDRKMRTPNPNKIDPKQL